MAEQPFISVAIIGGGAGGLGTAIALAQLPFLQVTLYENNSEPREAAAGISLGANAWKVLDLLGASQGVKVNKLCLLYYDQGKLEKAEEMYQRALAGYEKTLGPDHPSTLASVSNLGLVLDSQGKYEEAEAMHRRALEGYKEVLGREHPDTLTSVDNLA
ncbi:FAD-binding monooxygenase [Penicillium argentinense]|uniref:FAD-binding monooxygenase n=1 Tax=Penicillium argentinense TaxID=1131581 RepID=A0A9W9G1R5_9EURO|nr:FAD-binding monooxygenase [Penicillium argentinense]KAJ5110529.1 FAD-binding monooxygenase [Penicillium argentinense]